MAQIVTTKCFHLCLARDRIEHAKQISRIRPIALAVEDQAMAFERADLR